MPIPAILGGQPAFDKLVPFSNPGFIPSPVLLENISKVLEGGIFSKGNFVDKFEDECAKFLGVKNVVAVSSCVSGLILSLRILDLSGEVIVPSFTFPAAPTAIVQSGLIPVFADCEPETFNIDFNHIERLISKKTAAIMPVCNYGLPPNIKKLEKISEKYGIPLTFDSAQAFGASYHGEKMGRFGKVEVFSLSQSKVLTTCEGGLVATQDDSLAEKIRMGRNYGKSDSGEFLFSGLSSRLSEIHALIGLEVLGSIPSSLDKRRDLSKLYRENLKSIEGIHFQIAGGGMQSAENYFPIFIDRENFGLNRDMLYMALRKENIEVRKFFSPPSHRHKAFKKSAKEPLPITERASEECLALPFHPELKEEKVIFICDVVERIYNCRKEIKELS